MFDVKIMSLNVRGLGNGKKRREIFHWLNKEKFDIFLLQETHSTKEKELVWRSEWGHLVHYAHGTSNSKGVCILFKRKCNYFIHSEVMDPAGRYLILDVNDQKFTLANVYGPNEDDPGFFHTIIEHVQSLPNKLVDLIIRSEV